MDEFEYIAYLIGRSGVDVSWGQLCELDVEDMEDGGMGSLRFLSARSGRRRARAIAVDEFLDADDVPVSVELSVDNYGDLFELDIFKADFSPVLRFPPSFAN